MTEVYLTLFFPLAKVSPLTVIDFYGLVISLIIIKIRVILALLLR